MNAGFFQGGIEEPGGNMISSYHPLLKTHSNQERDNVINHPSLPESIEELI